MDGNAFDAVTRRLAQRRSVLAVLVASGFNALLASGSGGAAASKCKPACPACRRCTHGKCKKQPDGTACAGGACQNGACQTACQPQCTGIVCGSDGCGGSCGNCPAGTTCQSGTCSSSGRQCDPSYPDVCIPSPPPDLDCRDIPYRNFRVLPPDPHGFDTDHDGIGCESA